MDTMELAQRAIAELAPLADGLGLRTAMQAAETDALAPHMLSALLGHELVAGHATMMKLSAKVDRWLRLALVTPDMHRVHHSIEEDEANSNFGFNLSIWDRLFGTYRAQPRAGQTAMTIGIRGWDDPRQVAWLSGLLMIPFRGEEGEYALNRRRWGQARGPGSPPPSPHRTAPCCRFSGRQAPGSPVLLRLWCTRSAARWSSRASRCHTASSPTCSPWPGSKGMPCSSTPPCWWSPADTMAAFRPCRCRRCRLRSLWARPIAVRCAGSARRTAVC